MGVGEDFKAFCTNLIIKNRSDISDRYQAITKRLNMDFWNSTSNKDHSLYVGSYGRGTAIGISDLDVIFILPNKFYIKYSNYKNNGQSALLQEVRNSLRKTYPRSKIGGDGQVVVVYFSDGMKFEVVPAFKKEDGSFIYPDSNDGGKWKITNPKPEIETITKKNKLYNGNLKYLCRMMRAWKNKWRVKMGGLLIDTLAHNFLDKYKYNKGSYSSYHYMSRDFFLYLTNQDKNQQYWRSAGSSQYIWRKTIFESKAKQCYELSKKAIDYELKGMNKCARQTWRKIYGTAFPK